MFTLRASLLAALLAYAPATSAREVIICRDNTIVENPADRAQPCRGHGGVAQHMASLDEPHRKESLLIIEAPRSSAAGKAGKSAKSKKAGKPDRPEEGAAAAPSTTTTPK